MDTVTQPIVVLGPESPFLAVVRELEELVFVWRPSGEMLWVNDTFERTTGLTCEDFRFRNADNPFIPAEDLPRVEAHIAAFLESSEVTSSAVDNRFIDAWGTVHALSTVLHKVSWQGGLALMLVSKRQLDAQPVLAAVQDAQRRLMDSVGDGVFELSARGRVTFSNRVVQAWLGVRPVDIVKRPLLDLLELSARSGAQQALDSLRDGSITARFEAVLRGTGRVLDIKVTRITPDCGESVALAMARDITELKKLERSLQHAQRLESIGRLAGGVAHDFNNMLTTIGGNLALVLSDLPETSALCELLLEAQSAADSAASLTKQLLAFSRKQVIAPRVLVLNDVVSHTRRMLERVLGEDVVLQVDLEPRLAPIHMDLGQLEQILVNLCVNARDAMPRGGQLTIATASVEHDASFAAHHPTTDAQSMVCLTVSDNGVGITDEDREHIFEPFFTTKGPTQGTGLGLAMVYGAMQQNRGCIEVDSTPGQGTTFRLYFRTSDRPPDRITAPPPPTPLPARGDETIVLVEDEPMVRTVAERVLSRLGYRVLAYPSGAQALADIEARSGGEVSWANLDLLVTDVVMPNMDGRKLAERMRALRPGLRVLFTSGYAAQVMEEGGGVPEGFAFLPKPYSGHALANRVRKLLDQN